MIERNIQGRSVHDPTSLPETPFENIRDLQPERNMIYVENPEDGDIEVIHKEIFTCYDCMIDHIKIKYFPRYEVT